MRDGVLWGWIGPLLVTAFAAVLRLHELGRPHDVVFDETYYAKDAFSLIRFGVERATYGTNDDPIADRMLLRGDLDIFERCVPPDAAPCPEYVVHPPLGKWMIGVGEWLFGVTPFGWRVAAAVAGVVSVLIVARVARRMTRSTLLGCLAGLLLAVDGLHFVLSRTALLDVFLMMWVLAGFACLVADRDWARARLAAWVEQRGGVTGAGLEGVGPSLGWRPWRIAAGVCLGAACAVKWSGIFFLIAFGVMSLVWDAGARRAAGLRTPYRGAVRLDAQGAFGALALVPAAVYVLSWTGWFASPLGYGRNWDRATSQGPVYFVFDSVRSWIGYQLSALNFHTGLEDDHPYQSEPWQWPMLLRPVVFHYSDEPEGGCGAAKCSEEILGVGTPVIWFAAILALIAMIAWYVATRDWRAGAVLLAYAAGWLPWFYYAIADNRTMFLFYMAPLLPFMVLTIVLAAGLLIGPAGAPARRTTLGAAVTGAFTLLALANFAWLYPVLSAEPLMFEEWRARMLWPSWI
ncbi:dolichyl-phosphate-mannose--protein mannosyltransferase [Thermostaphylospora chromogena]|nr:phospholipid carrier-dependent glycosyltransferase [Thermostaphylospora chromogena]